MANKQIQFKRPVTLRNDKGEEQTFGKGVRPVDESFCKGWFYDGLKKEGGIIELEVKPVVVETVVVNPVAVNPVAVEPVVVEQKKEAPATKKAGGAKAKKVS